MLHEPPVVAEVGTMDCSPSSPGDKLPRARLFSYERSLSQRTTLGALLAREAAFPNKHDRRSSLRSTSSFSSCDSVSDEDGDRGKPDDDGAGSFSQSDKKSVRFATHMFNDELCCLVRQYKSDTADVPKNDLWWSKKELEALYDDELEFLAQFQAEYGKALKAAYDLSKSNQTAEQADRASCFRTLVACSHARGLETEAYPSLRHRKKKHRRAVLEAQDDVRDEAFPAEWISCQSKAFSKASQFLAARIGQVDRRAAYPEENEECSSTLRRWSSSANLLEGLDEPAPSTPAPGRDLRRHLIKQNSTPSLRLSKNGSTLKEDAETPPAVPSDMRRHMIRQDSAPQIVERIGSPVKKTPRSRRLVKQDSVPLLLKDPEDEDEREGVTPKAPVDLRRQMLRQDSAPLLVDRVVSPVQICPKGKVSVQIEAEIEGEREVVAPKAPVDLRRQMLRQDSAPLLVQRVLSPVQRSPKGKVSVQIEAEIEDERELVAPKAPVDLRRQMLRQDSAPLLVQRVLSPVQRSPKGKVSIQIEKGPVFLPQDPEDSSDEPVVEPAGLRRQMLRQDSAPQLVERVLSPVQNTRTKPKLLIDNLESEPLMYLSDDDEDELIGKPQKKLRRKLKRAPACSSEPVRRRSSSNPNIRICRREPVSDSKELAMAPDTPPQDSRQMLFRGDSIPVQTPRIASPVKPQKQGLQLRSARSLLNLSAL